MEKIVKYAFDKMIHYESNNYDLSILKNHKVYEMFYFKKLFKDDYYKSEENILRITNGEDGENFGTFGWGFIERKKYSPHPIVELIILNNNIGSLLNNSYPKLLDIGSGYMVSAESFLYKNNNFTYHSIDIEDNINYPFLETIKEHKHYKTNYEIVPKDMKQNYYDIVIIDICPHGHEIEIYELYKPFLKKEHLCLFQCLGSCEHSYAYPLLEKSLKYSHRLNLSPDKYFILNKN